MATYKRDSALDDDYGPEDDSNVAQGVSGILRNEHGYSHANFDEPSPSQQNQGPHGAPPISDDLLRRVRARREADMGMQVDWQMVSCSAR